MKRILIADDHPIIRNGVIQIIKEINSWDMEFLEANTFKEAEDILKDNRIDLLILDIKMPGMNAISSVTHLKRLFEDLKILIFSSYEEMIHATRYIQAGANGYLQKDSDEKEIQSAVYSIIEKGRYLSTRMAEEIIFNNHAVKRIAENPFSLLSNRETEVAQLMINGLGNLEIANELNLKESTVSTYKTRIFEKLGVRTITDLFILHQNYSSSQLPM